MHSLYSFQKSQEKLQKAQQEEEKFHKMIEKREKSKSLLAQKYKRRIEALIDDLPCSVKVKQTHTQTPKVNRFYTNYKTEKERVSLSETNNKWLDPVPFNRPSYHLRKRNRSKEISSDFHFKEFSFEKRQKSCPKVFSEKSLISGKTFQSFITLGIINHNINKNA